MIVMCFDLSSVCIGITFAQIHADQLKYVKTIAVIPKSFTGKDAGYTTAKPKKIQSNGKEFPAFLKPGEHKVSESEAKKRMAAFKVFKHRELLRDIGKQCGHFLYSIKPAIVAIERNKAFNGVLTTKLLAEIAGAIYFYSGSMNIPIYDEDEATIRAQIRRDIPNVDLRIEGSNKVVLDTKWEIRRRLQHYFETNHPHVQLEFNKMVLDESDSLAVFYYLYTQHLQK